MLRGHAAPFEPPALRTGPEMCPQFEWVEGHRPGRQDPVPGYAMARLKGSPRYSVRGLLGTARRPQLKMKLNFGSIMLSGDFTLDDLSNTQGDISNKPAPSGDLIDRRVHIMIKQRGRKHLTYVIGLDQSYNFPELLKSMKRKFSCNGSVQTEVNSDSKVEEQVLQFTGDQRQNVKNYLLEKRLVDQRSMQIHGY